MLVTATRYVRGMRSKHELAGMRVGRLVVKEFAGTPDGKHSRWKCICDCGNESVVLTQNLRNGSTHSCGCLQKEQAAEKCRERLTTHGLSGTPEYASWQDIKRRCYDPGVAGYHNYGGRGIGMHETWRDDVVQFIADIGKRPRRDMTLDRIDNDGDYEPGNVRWASKKTQARNRRDTVYVRVGKAWLVLADVSDAYGIEAVVLKGRLRRGWQLREALKHHVGGRHSTASRIWTGYTLPVHEHPDVRKGNKCL